MTLSQKVASVLLVFSAAMAATAQMAPSQEIVLSVDLTDAPKKIIHATETMTASPGPLTLVYPKWIPGEHGPTGPIDDMAGFVVTARAPNGQACGTSSHGRVKWERDKDDMYAFHMTVPEGCTSLEINLDFLATAAPTGFSAGASTNENLAMLSWNTVVVYPQGTDAADVTVRPILTLPSAWQFGTALHEMTRDKDQACSRDVPCQRVHFGAVSLEMLIDSPVLAGKYFKEVPLAPDVTPKHFLDMAADGPENLNLSAEHAAQFSRLVREAGALYQSRHYGEYHFLVTLSDSVAHFGLEHHQSSDDRVAAKTFVEDDPFLLAGDLLPHEFTHSWNGKYRRPAGLATSNYQKPMEGDLLWVYEGLTQYFGDVLAVRSGLWTPEQYRDILAEKAASLDNWPGRTWRDLQDTANMAQVLYESGGGWDNWRRKVDFYDESELIWLDVDTTLRKMSDGKKSLNDFAAAFEGLGGNTAPKVVPYTFNDVVASLNTVVSNDWTTFLRQRLDSNQMHAPLGGIEGGGYKLAYGPRPSAWTTKEDAQSDSANLWFSLGLRVNSGGTLTDVLKGGVADKGGFGPGMRLIAVNCRSFTPALLRAAVNDADGADGPPVELIVENSGYFRLLKLDYHGGKRYPMLERVAGASATLDDILQPLVKPAK
ncbi:MAG TPA: M61 family peptidase [Acidobacteriaceae bacterium]|jgi:predicted metalloprotease with PDZ domain